VLSSAFLEKGEILIINPLGLDGGKSLRTIQDGFTYFGCKKSIKKYSKMGNMQKSESKIKIFKSYREDASLDGGNRS